VGGVPCTGRFEFALVASRLIRVADDNV
jgi:hypothetical protein